MKFFALLAATASAGMLDDLLNVDFDMVSMVNGYKASASDDDYLAKSAQEKSDIIWSNITADESSGGWLHLPEVMVEGMAETFDSPGDEMPCYTLYCRHKCIHSVGNVAKVKFDAAPGTQYTGIFAGADQGYLRLSVAKPVSDSTQEMAPGMGLKFLRDGMDSANLVSMFSVDGQPSYNFFANDWTDHIPDITSISLLPLAAKFHTATDYIQAVGVSNFSSHNQDGSEVAEQVFPFSMRFEPTGEVEFSDTEYTLYTDELATIKAGTALFNIYGMSAPAELGGVETLMGTLVTDSEMVPSKWGDEHFFVRHQRAEEDIALKPEWEQYYPKYHVLSEDTEAMIENALNDISCPFFGLYNKFLQ